MTLAFDGAIVDLDGTLIDTLGDFEVVLNRMLLDLGLPPIDRSFIEQTVGKGSEYLIRRVLEHVGGEGSLFDAAWERYTRHYLEVNGDNAEVFPGVVEGLERMRDCGLKLGCLTNKPGAFARPLLQRKGLDRFFAVVFGGDAFERHKPDPLPLLKTCEALGTQPGRTLMIGDSSNDALAARGAGCPVVLVTYGYNHGEPVQRVSAHAHIDRLDLLSL
ncbi:MAG TPA: phosphoglycolate phosphatase [Burkholderiaceae bacterium]|nr:phosphoglycolate phosphatase [Burkholderiaceae bacterium]